jgi:hypothetical protein
MLAGLRRCLICSRTETSHTTAIPSLLSYAVGVAFPSTRGDHMQPPRAMFQSACSWSRRYLCDGAVAYNKRYFMCIAVRIPILTPKRRIPQTIPPQDILAQTLIKVVVR